MNRPWQIWLAFAAALALAAGALGWLSLRALDADRGEATAQQQALVEENVRLALWRMDSLTAAFVAQESARPAAVYRAFSAPPALNADSKRRNSEPLPSPLLVQPPPEVSLYFQRSAAGAWSSPQVPEGPDRERAVPNLISAERLQASEEKLSRVRELWSSDPTLLASIGPSAASEAPSSSAENANLQAVQIGSRMTPPPSAEEPAPQQELSQQVRGTNEFRRRSNYVTQNNTAAQTANAEAFLVEPEEAPPPVASMVPRIISGELFLVRTTGAEGETSLQGCWIDWSTLQRELLSEIDDLLPQAALDIADSRGDREGGRMLAALPVSLNAGAVVMPVLPGLSPVRLALVVAWGAMCLAAAAVAVLLRGVVTLSERRADFVSAVTHELRTPLTTFRMYAEMLAEGMVPDEAARRRYLETLRVEADRLTHLVENVLAYARLERGGMGNRIQSLTAQELLSQSTGRLSDRAREAGFELTIVLDQSVNRAQVLCDPSAVEQILFNLIDNACKYAAGGADQSLQIDVTSRNGLLELRVIDHGPGVPTWQRGKLFQPFRKSAEAAARSAPGVGLGLALSRRLARDMGGDLRYDAENQTGAAFVLTLRLAVQRSS